MRRSISQNRIQPIHFPRFSFGAGSLEIGRRPHRLAGPAPARRKQPTARSSPPRRATSRATRAANTCSTAAGRKPMSAPAAAITRSSRSRCRSRRRPDAGCWCARARMPTKPRRALAAGLIELCRIARRLRRPRHLCDRAGIPLARRARIPAAHRSAVPLGKCRLRHLRRISSPRSPRASARPSAANAHDALGQRHQRALAHRQRPDRRACGTRSSRSTWRPARANGAGPI